MTLAEQVLGWCDTWMQRHPWDHNAHHHRWILRRLPHRVDRALDVGCGTGRLARRLSRRAWHVDAVDTDPAVLEVAQALTPTTAAVRFTRADVLDLDRPAAYDAVTAVAVLHHLPLTPGLRRLRSLLAPGGRLVVLGLYREDTARDRLLGIAAVPVNLVAGTVATWRRGLRGRGRPRALDARTAAATATLADIRRVAERELPGAVLRRHLLWRFSLVWTAPA